MQIFANDVAIKSKKDFEIMIHEILVWRCRQSNPDIWIAGPIGGCHCLVQFNDNYIVPYLYNYIVPIAFVIILLHTVQY